MVTDRQVRVLFEELASGKTLAGAAARADMSERTARRYRKLGRLPGEVARLMPLTCERWHPLL